VIGGMIAATALAIIFVPLFFRLVTRTAEHGEKPAAQQPAAKAQAAE
jgi:multidrug efflux pump